MSRKNKQFVHTNTTYIGGDNMSQPNSSIKGNGNSKISVAENEAEKSKNKNRKNKKDNRQNI